MAKFYFYPCIIKRKVAAFLLENAAKQYSAKAIANELETRSSTVLGICFDLVALYPDSFKVEAIRVQINRRKQYHFSCVSSDFDLSIVGLRRGNRRYAGNSP